MAFTKLSVVKIAKCFKSKSCLFFNSSHAACKVCCAQLWVYSDHSPFTMNHADTVFHCYEFYSPEFEICWILTKAFHLKLYCDIATARALQSFLRAVQEIGLLFAPTFDFIWSCGKSDFLGHFMKAQLDFSLLQHTTTGCLHGINKWYEWSELFANMSDSNIFAK